jgi:methylmalonyl-CoA mutase N-terminal domain/subunit
MVRKGKASSADEVEERRSTSGFVTELHYDSLPAEPDGRLPAPGEYPFTRGFTAIGYREEPWVREMYAGFGSAEEANRRYRFLIENGASGGVSVALDLPTQIGFDSDDPMSLGEVGRIGVALDSYADIEQMFSGLDLARAGHVFSTANCIGPVMYAWILTYCRRHDVDPSVFDLQLQNDPIKEYVARGTHFLPIEASVRLATDVMVYSAEYTPNWLPISVSGSHMKQAGASPMQEAAFTLANGLTYLDVARDKGLNVADFHPSLEFHFCTDMDFFEEIAKYRAVRRVWSQIARSHYGVPDEKLEFRLHAATSGLPLTAQQPLNNISRITLQALAQVLGGVAATRTASWDEALGIPTEAAAKTSLRINQIMAYETGIPDATDPLGGSYYVEQLTDQMARAVREEIDKIVDMGGAISAVESGYYSDTLAAGAYQQQRDLDDGKRAVIGINRWAEPEPAPHPRFTQRDDPERRQLERLRAAKAGRDESAVRKALGSVRDACASTDNVIPSVLEAADAGATIGEICRVWRETFGEYREMRMVI